MFPEKQNNNNLKSLMVKYEDPNIGGHRNLSFVPNRKYVTANEYTGHRYFKLI